MQDEPGGRERPRVDIEVLAGAARAPLADPVLLRVYERAAADIVTDSFEQASYSEWDPAVAQMTAAERDAFVTDTALALAPVLLRAALAHGILDLELPTDWLTRRRTEAR